MGELPTPPTRGASPFHVGDNGGGRGAPDSNRTLKSLRRRRRRLPARDAIYRPGLQLPPAHLFHGARLRLDVHAARVLPLDGQRVGIEHSVASALVA